MKSQHDHPMSTKLKEIKLCEVSLLNLFKKNFKLQSNGVQ